MFDSAPSNLPVEPPARPPVPPVPPPMPAADPGQASAPVMPMATSSKKEPEDIFAGLDQSITVKPLTAPPTGPERGPFPVKLVLLIVGGIVVLAGIGYAVWAFVIAPKSEPTPAPVVQTPVPSAAAPSVPIEQPPVVVETPPPAPETPSQPVTQPPPGTNIPTPTVPQNAAVVPTEGKDSDGDALTDMEEPYYGADPMKADTDGDGYTDGSEVANLFSPAAKGMALSAAPFMSLLSWGNMSMLAPKPWSLMVDPATPTRAAITTASAARFQFEQLPNPEKQSLQTWLGAHQIATAKTFKTKGGFEAAESADGYTTYLSIGDSVLRVTYDLNGDPSIEYRTSYAMLVNSIAKK